MDAVTVMISSSPADVVKPAPSAMATSPLHGVLGPGTQPLRKLLAPAAPAVLFEFYRLPSALSR